MKRLLSFLLSVTIVISMVTTGVFATGDTTVVSEGACGENLEYQLIRSEVGEYILKITGSGDMMSFDNGNPTPWGFYYEDITTVTIEEGATSISSGAFSDCTELKTVDMAFSVETIGEGAFSDCSFELLGWMNHASGIYAKAHDNVILKLKQLRLLTIGNSHTDDYTAHFSTILGDLKTVMDTEIVHSQVLYGGRRLIYDEGSTRSHYIAANDPAMPGHADYVNAFAKTWDMVLIQDYRESVQFGADFADEIQFAVRWMHEVVPGAQVGWVADWAEPITKYPYSNSIAAIKAVQALTENTPDFIIPLSTIVDNARSSYFGTTMNNRGVSAAAPTAHNFAILERDEKHMSLELGRYLIGVCVLAHTLDYLDNMLILDEGADAFECLTTAPVYPDWNGEFVDDYWLVIEETAVNSLTSPLEITQSQYTKDPFDAMYDKVAKILTEVLSAGDSEGELNLNLITDDVIQKINDETDLGIQREDISLGIKNGYYGVIVDCSYGYSTPAYPVLGTPYTGISDGYYYVDGVITYGGLLHLDTDGDGVKDAFYYARTSGQIICGQDYRITKTNGLLPADTYTFGADGKLIHDCADADKDHKCDLCKAEVSKCADADKNHKCDICDVSLSRCDDADKDHVCDFCKVKITCADTDKDHKCDICEEELSKCADEDKDHKCDICKEELSKCADEDKDHKCDTCKAELSKCEDTDKDHKCDTCKAEVSKCADEDRDLKCDVCGADLGGEGADQFEDLETEDWFYEAVDYIVSAGIMNGTGDGNFNPDGKTTRAMIVTTLYRLEGEPSYTVENEYTDVDEDSWYTDAVLWATEKEIVTGYGNGKFGPSDNVTREQIATIFKRYAEFKGLDVEADADLTAYPDHETVSPWAVEGMEWAVASGLLKGMEIGGVVSLTPNGVGGEATRAQLATILYRWLTEN